MKVVSFTQRAFSNPALKRDAAEARRPLALRWATPKPLCCASELLSHQTY